MIDNNSPIPKYLMLKEHIKNMIKEGKVNPGDLLPSENEFAKKFNISRHTVRQAIGQLEKEGWIYRVQGKGTFCALNMTKTVKKSVAVLTTYISDYIFPHIIMGIEEELSLEGYSLILSNTNNDKKKEAKCMENMIKNDIVGMIIEPAASAKENSNIVFYRELDRRNIKYVMLHAAYEELDPAYTIMDDEYGGYIAAKYLLELGHKNIAGIFKSDDLQGIKRRQGFLKALSEFEVPIRQDHIGNYETKQISYYPYQFTKSLLQRTNKPTAIMCYNDQIAFSVMEAVRDKGLKIPDDISVIGYDDSSLAVISEVKLTTVRHPKNAMGRQAAKFLIEMLQGREDKPRMIYKPELIVRSSCRSI